jgi:hypothetical protein
MKRMNQVVEQTDIFKYNYLVWQHVTDEITHTLKNTISSIHYM